MPAELSHESRSALMMSRQVLARVADTFQQHVKPGIHYVAGFATGPGKFHIDGFATEADAEAAARKAGGTGFVVLEVPDERVCYMG